MLQREETKEQHYQNSLLSATQPKPKLSLQQQEKKVIKTITISKSILVVYLDPDTKEKLIDSAAAYALHLTNVRSVMLDSPRLVRIPDSVIEKLNQDPRYEITYRTLPPKTKEKIIVYYADDGLYLDSAAAYAVGLMDVQRFYMEEGKYGPLSDNEAAFIKTQYEVTFQKLEQTIDKKVDEQKSHLS